jgi:hypothetical protein
MMLLLLMMTLSTGRQHRQLRQKQRLKQRLQQQLLLRRRHWSWRP